MAFINAVHAKYECSGMCNSFINAHYYILNTGKNNGPCMYETKKYGATVSSSSHDCYNRITKIVISFDIIIWHCTIYNQLQIYQSNN
jgi:hypothetical protein